MSLALELSKKYKTLLEKHKINTPKRLLHFFTQAMAESRLVAKRESLYYTTIAGARANFYTPFKGKSNDFVRGYLKNSVKMANYVYANRMGNGNVASGDGYRNRGGGWFQHTGANEYRILTTRTGLDFYGNPDLLLGEVHAIIAAIDYWNRLGLSSIADRDGEAGFNALDYISDMINIGRHTSRVGDANGYDHRLKYYNEFKKEFL